MIVTITGPSCAGKSTLEKRLKARGFSAVVSTTTRPMREGEVDGESYYFIDKSMFKRLKTLGAFVESTEFNGNYYGVSRAELTRATGAGKPVVIVCEPHGQKQIAKYCADSDIPMFAVFVDGDEDVIASRFLKRFVTDFVKTMGKLDGAKFEGLVETYASRMKDMMTAERAWVAEAWAGEGYHMIIDRYDDTNAEFVADRITEIANQPERKAA